MAKEKEWHSVVVPYEWFQLITKNNAAIFRITDGDYEGYSFVRPAVLMRKSYRKGEQGLELSYSVEQEVDEDGDIVKEEVEEINLQLREKQGKGKNAKYEVVDEETIRMDDLDSI